MACSRRASPALVCLLLCCAALGTTDVFATIVLPAEFGQMVAGSQTVVHGRVSGVSARMPGGRRSIESTVTVDVVATLKGEERAAVTFRVPNGRVGRYRRITVGAPEFSEGDEVILFLQGRAPALPVPFGLTQGVYRVSRSTGRAVVTPLLAADPGRIVRGDPARRPLSLDDFSRYVRAVVAR